MRGVLERTLSPSAALGSSFGQGLWSALKAQNDSVSSRV